MTREETKQFILSHLNNHDDLERMEAFCKDKTAEQMQEPFGHPGNGITREQYLNVLRERRKKFNAARALVASL